MSYQRLYPQRINWEDEPSLATPINQVNLNKMDSALFGIDGRVVELDENKVGKTETFNTSRNGVVPKPTQADITNEKVLRADGVWVEQSGGGGGGGGHTIVDNAGTSLQQRGKLKTVGGLNATDDSENNTTKITDEYEIIPWATWQEYSDAEKAEHPNAIITGAPDCDGTLEIENQKSVWTNPNPTSAFPATESDRTITLNIDGDYDTLTIISALSTSYSTRIVSSITILKGKDGMVNVGSTRGASYISEYTRTFTYISDTSYQVGDAVTQNSGSTSTTDNSFLIPLEIFVGKKKLTAKIKAIAHDVKATVDYSTSEHKIGKWIDGSDLYETTVNYGALPNTDRVLVNHNISNLASVYEIRAIAVSPSQSFAIPTANPSAQNASINVEVTSTQIGIRTGRDFSSYNAYITLRYTKTS